MIAWDAGREAARAVHDALPVLERAKSVVVLVINPRRGNHGAEPGADIALHLARHGIKVEAQNTEVKDLSVADALLSRLADQGIDLLVMGAYGHSRLRELVVGGVTRQLFQQMTVPVLMSH
jgi:nucleotide-binding universal stress UspA family protein